MSALKPPRAGLLQRRVRGTAWRSTDILRATAIVTAVYLAVRLIELVHPLLLTTFLGLLFGLGVARGADALVRARIPRPVAALLIVAIFYALLYGAATLTAPILSRQFTQLRTHLPEAIDRVEQWLIEHRGGLLEEALREETSTPRAATQPAPAGPSALAPASADLDARARHRLGGPAATPPAPSPTAGPATGAAPPGASPLRRTLARQLGSVTQFLFPFLSSTVEVIGALVLITFIAIYLSIDPGLYRRGLLHLVPHAARRRADEVMHAITATLRRWLLAQLAAMVMMGLVVSVSLMMLGVEAAISLGVIAGLLEFIPTIGPILAALPATAMGFLVSPEKALEVLVVFTILQQAEGNLLIPLLMKKGVELPPLITLLGQAVMAVVFGFLGLVTAVPLVACVAVAVKMLYVEDVVGDAVETPTESG